MTACVWIAGSRSTTAGAGHAVNGRAQSRAAPVSIPVADRQTTPTRTTVNSLRYAIGFPGSRLLVYLEGLLEAQEFTEALTREIRANGIADTLVVTDTQHPDRGDLRLFEPTVESQQQYDDCLE